MLVEVLSGSKLDKLSKNGHCSLQTKSWKNQIVLNLVIVLIPTVLKNRSKIEKIYSDLFRA